LDRPGLHGPHEVVEDLVDRVLVKDAHVPESSDVKLQALELHALLVGDVLEVDRGEIGEPRLRANAVELGDFQVNLVVPVGVLVFPGLQVGKPQVADVFLEPLVAGWT
jgi:hypothetical protein